ncbi:hypothetical protein [Phycicoccus sp. 3266]|uniref:hypothetical protein n=1 Tax=Phycicoccus sp. 3266 TaxID=2817751 RepID=UPI002856AFC0|nr:hypothetical protein [Phycicoccus sp. 3266]MDR6862132.1 hypothetical protein [Phycicoccus sp. 3266]
MSILAKRVLLAALTGIGLVLLVVGAWFTSHLGTSGSATFRATPGTGVVVLEPSVLNRVDDPVDVTATTKDGGQVWIGRTSPSDAKAVVGGSAHTSITGSRVSTWKLAGTTSGTGAPAADLAGADVWRQTVTGKGRAHVEVDQGDAPEALVVAAPGGTVTSVTLTISRGTWFAQSLLTALVGLILAAVGAVGLVGTWRRSSGGPAEGADDTNGTPAVATHDEQGDARDEQGDARDEQETDVPASSRDATDPAPEVKA